MNETNIIALASGLIIGLLLILTIKEVIKSRKKSVKVEIEVPKMEHAETKVLEIIPVPDAQDLYQTVKRKTSRKKAKKKTSKKRKG